MNMQGSTASLGVWNPLISMGTPLQLYACTLSTFLSVFCILWFFGWTCAREEEYWEWIIWRFFREKAFDDNWREWEREALSHLVSAKSKKAFNSLMELWPRKNKFNFFKFCFSDKSVFVSHWFRDNRCRIRLEFFVQSTQQTMTFHSRTCLIWRSICFADISRTPDRLKWKKNVFESYDASSFLYDHRPLVSILWNFLPSHWLQSKNKLERLIISSIFILMKTSWKSLARTNTQAYLT